MALNKGGRLEGKVTEVGGGEFTVQLEGKGHEKHEKEISFPVEAFNGRGAEVGEGLGYAKPAQGPQFGDRVLVNLDAKTKAAAASNEDE